jgi:F-type H+-transporting ATPase subunit b
MAETSNALLRFEPGLMIWTGVVFVVLLAVLRKIAWKPLLQALDEREKQIHHSLEQAQQIQRDTERVGAENQRRIDEAIQKAEQIIQQSREQGEQSRRQIVEEARAESRRVVDQGLRRLEAEQRAAMQEVRAMAADLAIQAAGRLIQTSLNEQQQREIVEKFLREIPEKSTN